MASCFPRASGLSRLSFIVPSVAAACFWLVVVCKIFNRRPSKAMMYFLFLFFAAPFDTPNNGTTSPTHSVPVASPLQCPFHCRQRLLVGCCVPTLNGGHLRPRVHPSLNLFCRLFRPPKRRAAVLPTRSNPALPLFQRTL